MDMTAASRQPTRTDGGQCQAHASLDLGGLVLEPTPMVFAALEHALLARDAALHLDHVLDNCTWRKRSWGSA
eukprot:3627061-Rhodomonas_salina.1